MIAKRMTAMGGLGAAMALTGCFSAGGGGASAEEPPDGGGGGGASYTCTAADADDGTSAAAGLGASSLDCQYYRSSALEWATAMSYCAGLGSGWRLASKGEALKIASSSYVCRTPLSGAWWTWIRTCAGAGLAWVVAIDGVDGVATENHVDNYGNILALCVR